MDNSSNYRVVRSGNTLLFQERDGFAGVDRDWITTIAMVECHDSTDAGSGQEPHQITVFPVYGGAAIAIPVEACWVLSDWLTTILCREQTDTDRHESGGT
jgi:hypothetical protein